MTLEITQLFTVMVHTLSPEVKESSSHSARVRNNGGLLLHIQYLYRFLQVL